MDVLLGDAKHLALCHYTWVKSRKWAGLPTRVQCSWGVGTQGWIPGLGILINSIFPVGSFTLS